MDIVSREVRSRMMSGIRGSNTSPEMKVRKLPHQYGNRYRLHQRNTPGRPGMVLARFRVCIFVHGCFWKTKFEQNRKRDLKIRKELLQQGWRVIELWECGIRRPEAEMNWLLESIPDSNQKYVSGPAFL